MFRCTSEPMGLGWIIEFGVVNIWIFSIRVLYIRVVVNKIVLFVDKTLFIEYGDTHIANAVVTYITYMYSICFKTKCTKIISDIIAALLEV